MVSVRSLTHTGCAALLLLWAFAARAADSNLTREEAKNKLNSALASQPSEPPLDWKCGLDLGLWTYDTKSQWPWESLVLTEKGKEFFKVERGVDTYIRVRTKTPCSVVESIDGITDLPMGVGKQVEYTWGYQGLPQDVMRCVKKASGSARGVLKLYDDGWRIMNLGVSR